MTARSPNMACSASNMGSRWPIPRRWCCGKRSSAISPMARRSSSISISRRVRPSGCAPTGWCCCCRTASKARGRSIPAARLERFLQLCANDNLQVCNITSPANYFHVLRRQMLRPFRKPLVIMTPKSLLRHPMAKSDAKCLSVKAISRRILSDKAEIADAKVRRLVLCSGKVAYDLMERARCRRAWTMCLSSGWNSSIPSPANRWRNGCGG